MNDSKIKYINPADVISPKDLISNVEVLFDGGNESFSMARLTWYGTDGCYAMRWNVSNRELDNEQKANGNIPCIGLPQSHGHPTWFILPEVIKDYIDDIKKQERERICKEHTPLL